MANPRVQENAEIKYLGVILGKHTISIPALDDLEVEGVVGVTDQGVRVAVVPVSIAKQLFLNAAQRVAGQSERMDVICAPSREYPVKSIPLGDLGGLDVPPLSILPVDDDVFPNVPKLASFVKSAQKPGKAVEHTKVVLVREVNPLLPPSAIEHVDPSATLYATLKEEPGPSREDKLDALVGPVSGKARRPRTVGPPTVRGGIQPARDLTTDDQAPTVSPQAQTVSPEGPADGANLT